MYKKFSEGMIEVITGPMFSGKSDELLKRIITLSYANVKTLIFKPTFDTRFSDDEIVSRSGAKMKAYNVKDSQQIREIISQQKSKFKAIAIDEVHFFDKDLIFLIDELANSGYRVIVSGLDQDFLRRPFTIMPQLLAMAEHIDKLQAICVVCKNAASTTFRKVNKSNIKLIGDTDEYESRCRSCHIKGEYAKLTKMNLDKE
ncbi:thymidine kinase [Mycoplasma iguanae]|uniref:Thymidine kinase n=1 Tax=Mycoplasma iguanae TaxID=292461 RepID=A0ABY5R988_9MOLU|nr:thymidine kinase [Mycoplasma iguanae]UVD81856.1 thymidine kinase [Mycoplasma iguanae]